MDAVIECILYAIVVVTRTAGNEIPMYGEALLEEQQQQEEQPEEEEEEEKKVDQRYKHDEEEKKVEQRHKHDEEEKKVEQRHKHGEETWGKEREETMPACIREVTDVQRGIMGVQKGDWILLTGASGFVASYVLSALIDAGYNVKCVVTSTVEADNILKLRSLYSAHLAFSIVTDAAVPGAFDDAVAGVMGVIHMASSFVPDRADNRHTPLDRVIQGTTNLLASVLQHNVQCKRVVVASDVAAILSAEAGMHPSPTDNAPDRNRSMYEDAAHARDNVPYISSMTAAERSVWDVVYGGPKTAAEHMAWDAANGGSKAAVERSVWDIFYGGPRLFAERSARDVASFVSNSATDRTAWDVAYVAYNTVAERAAWDFMKKHTYPDSISRPAFSLATVCCPVVYGPTEPHTRLDTLNASRADIYRLINGSERSVSKTRLHAWVDVRDAAQGHVRVLEAAGMPVGTEDRYLVAAGGYSYTEVCKIIQKWFPHLVNTGLTPNPEGAPLRPPHYPVENGRSVRELGMAYRPLEECIVDAVHSLLNHHANKDSKQKKRAPISDMGQHADYEVGSRSLVGTELMVCACNGITRKSCSNPTTPIAQHGPEPGVGTAPKEWREIGDLGVSGLGLDGQPNPVVCGCVDPATCGTASTGVCFYTTVGASAYLRNDNHQLSRADSDCSNDNISPAGSSTYDRSGNDQPARPASDCRQENFPPTPTQLRLTLRGASPVSPPAPASAAYVVPEGVEPLLVPETSASTRPEVADRISAVPVMDPTAAIATATTTSPANATPVQWHRVGGLGAAVQQAVALPSEEVKCSCSRMRVSCEEVGGTCSCVPACGKCEHCAGHVMGKPLDM